MTPSASAPKASNSSPVAVSFVAPSDTSTDATLTASPVVASAEADRPGAVEAKESPSIQPCDTLVCPDGYVKTVFPCFPCKRDGLPCFVSRNRSVMPCTNVECQAAGPGKCCADQRVVQGLLSTEEHAKLDRKEKLHAEYQHLRSRIRSVLLQDAHRGKEKVGGYWTEQDWTPIDMTKPLIEWHDAARRYDNKLNRDLRLLHVNEREGLAEEKDLMTQKMPFATAELSKTRKDLKRKHEDEVKTLTQWQERVKATQHKLTLAEKVIKARRDRNDY